MAVKKLGNKVQNDFTIAVTKTAMQQKLHHNTETWQKKEIKGEKVHEIIYYKKQNFKYGKERKYNK